MRSARHRLEQASSDPLRLSLFKTPDSRQTIAAWQRRLFEQTATGSLSLCCLSICQGRGGLGNMALLHGKGRGGLGKWAYIVGLRQGLPTGTGASGVVWKWNINASQS